MAGAITLFGGSFYLNRRAFSSEIESPSDDFLTEHLQDAKPLREKIESDPHFMQALNKMEMLLKSEPDLLHFLGYHEPNAFNLVEELEDLKVIDNLPGGMSVFKRGNYAFYSFKHNTICYSQKAQMHAIIHETLHALHYKRLIDGINKDILRKILQHRSWRMDSFKNSHPDAITWCNNKLRDLNEYLKKIEDDVDITKEVRKDAVHLIHLIGILMGRVNIIEAVGSHFDLRWKLHRTPLHLYSKWIERLLFPTFIIFSALPLIISGRKQKNQKYSTMTGYSNNELFYKTLQKGLFESLLD
ncbi:MAG: hypothetical protein ABIE74_10325 [Pseudomonadota bacterium]